MCYYDPIEAESGLDRGCLPLPEDRGYKWKNLGLRIREARLRAGLTQREVGELVGVKTHTVWCWESGRMKPTHEHLVELVAQCGVSAEWLLGEDSVEKELLKEAEVSFREAVAGLPPEDVESIRDFISFVRAQRRRKGKARR